MHLPAAPAGQQVTSFARTAHILEVGRLADAVMGARRLPQLLGKAGLYMQALHCIMGSSMLMSRVLSIFSWSQSWAALQPYQQCSS